MTVPYIFGTLIGQPPIKVLASEVDANFAYVNNTDLPFSIGGGFFANSASPTSSYGDLVVPLNGTTYVDNVLTIQNKSVNGTDHHGNAAFRMVDRNSIERAAFGYSASLAGGDLAAFIGNTAYIEVSNLNSDGQYTNFSLVSTNQALGAAAYEAWHFSGTTGHTFFSDHTGRGFVEIDPELNFLTLYGPASGNHIQFHSAATTLPVQISATGNDATVAIRIDAKGAAIAALASNGNYAFVVTNASATAVNYITGNGSAAGLPVGFTATGTDSVIGINYEDKAGGGHNIKSRANNALVVSNSNNSAVNWTTITGSPTGDPVGMGAAGSDTDIVLSLTPKGAGNLQVNGSATWSANASVATVLGSVGPSGAHTTVQEWFTVKNASGTVRYIAAF